MLRKGREWDFEKELHSLVGVVSGTLKLGCFCFCFG